MTIDKRLLAVALYSALAGPPVTALVLHLSHPIHNIPSAAAEEARIVCANFSGLDSFTVQRLDDEATPEGALRRYRITATCTSAHVVTGQIGVK